MKKSIRILLGLFLCLILAVSFAACGDDDSSDDEDVEITAFTVGGTVSGLSGQLVLQNNGKDALVVATNGSFTFETMIADGSSYAVTVSSQPSGPDQTCSVYNGSGTVSGANVTGVTVTCSTEANTVGGTVVGLSGTLVLQCNGADDKTMTSAGEFTFATPLADGSPYAVTILSDPPGQYCTLVNNTGTISGSDVSTVAVFCKTMAWVHPESLADDNISPDGQHADRPQVAMGDNGDAVIVWKQSDGGNMMIYKSEYRGGAWSNPLSLADDHISIGGQNADEQQVAMDNSGNAVIVWKQSNGGQNMIYKSEYRDGAWNHPVFLTNSISPTGQFAFAPQVAVAGNGDAVVVWSQMNGSNAQIYKSEYRGDTWNHPALLSNSISPVGYDALNPQVAMDGNGDAIVVWSQMNGSNLMIYKSEYRDGAWNHPAFIANSISPLGQNAESPQVAMGGNGDAIIVWEQFDGGTGCGGGSPCKRIYKSEYRGGTWTHPSGLSDNISPDTQNATYRKVAMDDSGNAVITWQQYNGSNFQVYKSDNLSGAWNHPVFLANSISPPGQHAQPPQVAMDKNSNAVITWRQNDGSNDQIYKSEYRVGAWTHPTDLAEDHISIGGYQADYPQVSMDGNKNAIITWTQSDGGYNQIYKSEYR